MKEYKESDARADIITGIIFGLLMIAGMYIGFLLIPPSF